MDAALVELLVTLDEKRPRLARTLRPAIESATESEILRSIAAPSARTPATIDPITLPRRDGRDVGIIVLGCGRGAVARRLATELRTSAASSTLIILETDAHRFLATLLVDEWADLLTDSRVRFAIGPYPDTALREAVPPPADPILDFALGGLATIAGDDAAHSGAIEAAFKTVVGTTVARFQSRCEQYVARVSKVASAGLPFGAWTLFSAVSDQTTALKSLARAIMDAAKRSGHDGRAHLTEQGDSFMQSRTLRRAIETDIDVVLSFLRPAGSIASWLRGLPSLVVVSSNPNLLPIETLPWAEQDLVVVTDPDFAAAYRRIGVQVEVRPLGTDVPSLEGMRKIEAPECDVLLVGNIPTAASVVPGLPSNLARLVEEVATDWVRHPDATIEQLMATTTIRGDPPLMDAIRLAVAYAATRRRRVAAAVALAAAGFDVRVHGENAWEEALAGTAAQDCWKGPLRPGLEQSAAFRNAEVAINVTSFATPRMLNMRNLDVPAAGGVLVTDDRPVLHEAFDVGTEVLSFSRIEELPDLVSGILRNHTLREEIARAGRQRVERDHSWDRWWAWAETRLRRRFTAAKIP